MRAFASAGAWLSGGRLRACSRSSSERGSRASWVTDSVDGGSDNDGGDDDDDDDDPVVRRLSAASVGSAAGGRPGPGPAVGSARTHRSHGRSSAGCRSRARGSRVAAGSAPAPVVARRGG